MDAVGVIPHVGTVSNFQPKDNSRPSKNKLTLTIADESLLHISLTLWGNNASKLHFEVGRVLAIKGAKVSDYNGKSLNAGDEHSQLSIDPDNKRVNELREWF